MLSLTWMENCTSKLKYTEKLNVLYDVSEIEDFEGILMLINLYHQIWPKAYIDDKPQLLIADTEAI